MGNEVELLPCPFCRGTAAWGEGEQKTEYGNEQVYCTNCYAMTPPESTKAKAATWWNARLGGSASSYPQSIAQDLKALSAPTPSVGEAGEPRRVLYSHYIAVAELLERTTKELQTAKAISAKRKDVLMEIRRLFYEAKFAPAIAEGCVKSPVSEYVRLLIEHSKNLEAKAAAPATPSSSAIPDSALYWLKAAKDESYTMAERLLFMENAYNHVVNALVAVRPATSEQLDLTWAEHLRDGGKHAEWHASCGCAYHPKPFPHVHPCSDEHKRPDLHVISTELSTPIEE